MSLATNDQPPKAALLYLKRNLPIEIEAYTPSPLQIAQTQQIGTTPQTLFYYVTNSSHICDFVPGVRRVKSDNEMMPAAVGLGSVRYCDFGRDMVIKEIIVLWQPPHLYGYQIETPNPFGIYNHFALVTCEAVLPYCRLSWYQFYDHADCAAMNKLMQTTMAGMMRNLVEKFKACLVNKTVSKNKHPK